MTINQNPVGIQCQAVAREIYVILREFIHKVYQGDAMGNLYHVQLDGTISVVVPWKPNGGEARLAKRQREIVRQWLMSKMDGKTPPPLIHNVSSGRWYLNLEDYPDVQQAMEWLRLHQMTPETYLAMYREAQVRTHKQYLVKKAKRLT